MAAFLFYSITYVNNIAINWILIVVMVWFYEILNPIYV